jgi:pantoate--beta-alanine ligase
VEKAMGIKRVSDPAEARAAVRGAQSADLTVGLVPTMGALHEGHASLIRASAAECDYTVVSVYVNPTQFGRGEDLERYPRRLADDCRLAEDAGADMVFCPPDEAIYPEGFCTYVVQDGLAGVLEGASRPGHFRGVLTVVCKLLNIVPADVAYFGRKDFQQTVVVRRMVRDLNLATRIRVMPTVREADGLAMSSRNAYLSGQERAQAGCLYRALCEAERLYRAGQADAATLCAAMQRVIAGAPLAWPEYVEIVDRETLGPVRVAGEEAVAVLAVRIGPTRLIDNMPFGAASP